MNTYTVTLNLADKESFQSFIDNVGPLVEKMTVSVNGRSPPAEQTPAPVSAPKPRVPRGSKVNDAILHALEGSSQTVKQLKAVLEDAGFSPGSLSTGLALLQKSGRVERIGEGLYALAGMKAAAE